MGERDRETRDPGSLATTRAESAAFPAVTKTPYFQSSGNTKARGGVRWLPPPLPYYQSLPQLEAESAGFPLAVRLVLVSLEERSERGNVLCVRRRHLRLGLGLG